MKAANHPRRFGLLDGIALIAALALGDPFETGRIGSGECLIAVELAALYATW